MSDRSRSSWETLFRTWDDREEKVLRVHADAGLTITTIAGAMGRSPGSIRSKLERERIFLHSRRQSMFVWTDEAIDFLKQKCAEPLSATQIAQAMRERFGHDFSRCSIIGKIDRLGIERNLPERKAPTKRLRKPRGLINLHKSKNRLRLVWSAPEIFNGSGISLAAIADHQCRYPLGEPNGLDTMFCGAAQYGEHSYCLPHYQLCHIGRSAA